MKVVAILQARMNSTRLPGKMLLPLAGAPLVQRVIERVQRAKRVDEVVLAFPVLDYPALSFLSHTRVNIYGYPGNENDLVGRYLGAAQAYGAEVIVRIPCDNPCLDPVYIDAAIEEYLTYPFVYYSNTTDVAEVGSMLRMVDGIGAEVVSLSRLQWLDAVTQGHPELREHPHRYFEQCGLLQLPKADLRLDVNTQADYDFIKDIYDHFHRNDFTAAEVVAYLESKKESA